MKMSIPSHQSLDLLAQKTLSVSKEKTNIILSVAIPTRNRKPLLCELIESILPQLSCSIQIVISDNASDDDTNNYCTSLLSGHHGQNFKFIQNAINIGMEKNLLRAVSECDGEYVWLMGDDDKIKPGAFEDILYILSMRDYATGLVNYEEFDYYFSCKLREYRFNITQDNLNATIEDMLKAAAFFFSFLSCHIVRKSLWMSTDLSRFEGQPTDSVQIYVPIIAGAQGSNFILARPILSKRNSRYNLEDIYTINIAQGWFESMEKAVEVGVSRNVVDNFYKEFINHLHLSRDILHKKINRYDAQLEKDWVILMRQYGRFSGYWLFVVPLFLVPRPLLCIILAAYRTMKRMLKWLPKNCSNLFFIRRCT